MSEPAVESILRELLHNAQKFHPDGNPEVQVVLDVVDPDTICLKVIDDGRTLPPDQLTKTWLPYYQIEKEFTGEVPGAGLGLAMVQSLAWEVGGDCQIRNRHDSPGVVVELILPLQRQKAAPTV
jgi:K+-sensing histidine kinase KdpD